MATQGDILGITSGFLHSFVGGLAKANDDKRRLLVDTVNQAVASGRPEAFDLLNPAEMQAHGMLELMPIYKGFAEEIKKKNDQELRRLTAQTGLAESQQRVAAAVEEPTIQAAKQKAELGGIELSQAQRKEQAYLDNPRLLMLPEEKAMKELEVSDARIQNMAEETKYRWAALGQETKYKWASLGEQARHHKAMEAKAGAQASAGHALEKMMVGELEKLSPEERKEVLINKISPGLESNLQKELGRYTTSLGTARKDFLAVKSKIDDRAAKAGKEPLKYETKEEALSDMMSLNAAAAAHNSIAGSLKDKFGQEAPLLPMVKEAPIPGWFTKAGGGYQLVITDPTAERANQLLGEALKEIGGGKKPAAEKPKVETPATKKEPAVKEPEAKKSGVGESRYLGEIVKETIEGYKDFFGGKKKPAEVE